MKIILSSFSWKKFSRFSNICACRSDMVCMCLCNRCRDDNDGIPQSNAHNSFTSEYLYELLLYLWKIQSPYLRPNFQTAKTFGKRASDWKWKKHKYILNNEAAYIMSKNSDSIPCADSYVHSHKVTQISLKNSYLNT